MSVYGLMADLHVHNWSSFASLDSEGRNTRLMHIIHEIHRCCAEVRRQGGDLVVIAGDVFHTRGEIKPSVFNPLRDALATEVSAFEMSFYIMPGNHDLEGRDSKALTSAVGMLSDLSNVGVTHDPQNLFLDSSVVTLLPWEPDIKRLLSKAILMKKDVLKGRRDPSETDLIIHAGIDGVLSGMPAHGLTADMLADLGFRRVFAGHYHNHRDMGRGVYSIGAPTHQTWSDVGTRAGWMVVSPTEAHFFASHAPSFIDITGEEDNDELPLIVDGHYVRARVAEATPQEVAELRRALQEMGALGSLVQSVPAKTAGKRTASLSAASLASLDRAVADYCAAKGLPLKVTAACDALLKEVRA